MSANATDDTERTAVDNEKSRYAELTVGREECVIYDQKNHQAWVQSTVAFELGEIL